GRLGELGELGDEAAEWYAAPFVLEAPVAAKRVLQQRFHAVVGNPPYITCKDKALRDRYRDMYVACHRSYGLHAPFTERFFDLAVPNGGFVGEIVANSFMKREFGKKLIEEVLSHVDVSHVVDISGAYIPGHSTPSVILFCR